MPATQLLDAELRSTLARIEAKLDMLLNNPSSQQSTASSNTDIVLLASFTTKQHAIIQMLMRDATNDEIASRLRVAPNTIKTHIAMIARKLGVQRRAAIITTIAPIYERISASAYVEASGGLPKNWDKNYEPADPINSMVENRGSHDD